jgi:hypothetical protein
MLWISISEGSKTSLGRFESISQNLSEAMIYAEVGPRVTEGASCHEMLVQTSMGTLMNNPVASAQLFGNHQPIGNVQGGFNRGGPAPWSWGR